MQDNHGAKWIKQFKSLFIVLNGQILSWQLVLDTSFDTVWNMMSEIKAQIESQGENLHEIYVDDCRKIQNKLHSIFGETTVIKPDLFHAIERITKSH